MTAPLSSYEASIRYVLRDGGSYLWTCNHAHRTEEVAFACASRETRRRFASSVPRKDIYAFNVSTRARWNEPGGVR